MKFSICQDAARLHLGMTCIDASMPITSVIFLNEIGFCMLSDPKFGQREGGVSYISTR